MEARLGKIRVSYDYEGYSDTLATHVGACCRTIGGLDILSILTFASPPLAGGCGAARASHASVVEEKTICTLLIGIFAQIPPFLPTKALALWRPTRESAVVRKAMLTGIDDRDTATRLSVFAEARGLSFS